MILVAFLAFLDLQFVAVPKICNYIIYHTIPLTSEEQCVVH